MSPAPTNTASAPQPSALPPSSDTSNLPHRENTVSDATSAPKVKPARKPLLRLELRDLSDDGTRAFLRLLHASTALETAIDANGVAYTTGRDIDEDHKEIHLSTDYINHVPESRQKEEIQGVIVHEMVHCWQHNALGTAPGGLIEGIADWVRLKAGFAPPHWKRTADGDWDAGYERTGFFLEWLEAAHGVDVVRKINEGLRGCKYDPDRLWHTCCGKSVENLWDGYKSSLGDGDSKQSPAEST
ncbi:uncharacterized protein N0V89_005379 [Didymosphaeria variabile]|uniref:BSP-domain-containing protein n=1 Tax=Didymosphaeria variabile TaxID=1932322 RepID=A0A9W9CBF1_9PLEO|nr:uncharacterized protein N0V89_005379 [Didymosphaeria variabile]KAJ4353649.1 hypothetical protein N0V89_005379 [Didymosphaeria variabile]